MSSLMPITAAIKESPKRNYHELLFNIDYGPSFFSTAEDSSAARQIAPFLDSFALAEGEYHLIMRTTYGE